MIAGRIGSRRAAGRSGFTTIELLIVVVIIGLIASMAMPRIAQTVARERVRRAQFVVGSQVELAYQYAARVRQPVTITFNTTTSVLTITNRVTSTVYKNLDLSRSGDYALNSASISPTAGITIFPTGLGSAALTVTLSNYGYTRTVTATIGGQVTKQ